MKNKYKLICLDLDGTLLKSNRKMDHSTVRFLRKLMKQGVHVAITTGRAGYDARHHAALVSRGTYYICANGAAGGKTSEHTLIYEDGMSTTAVANLIATADQLGIKPVFYSNDQTLISGLKDYIMHHLLMTRGNSELKKGLKYLPGSRSLAKNLAKSDSQIHKGILFIPRRRTRFRAERLLSNQIFEKALTFNICYELSSKGINKSHGIKKLSEYLGIEPEEIIAFGDSENDRDMLTFVGMGVAMGNAESAIKEIADRVADTNDQQGILKVLQEVYDCD